MDNGEVIPGLNESWTFAGAKVNEWLAGFVMFMMSGELAFGWGPSMPLNLIIFVSTTLVMASLRKIFPDEERGMRNAAMMFCGFAPPGIPKPALLEPVWSGVPVRKLREDSKWCALNLSEIFIEHEVEELIASDDYDLTHIQG